MARYQCWPGWSARKVSSRMCRCGTRRSVRTTRCRAPISSGMGQPMNIAVLKVMLCAVSVAPSRKPAPTSPKPIRSSIGRAKWSDVRTLLQERHIFSSNSLAPKFHYPSLSLSKPCLNHMVSDVVTPTENGINFSASTQSTSCALGVDCEIRNSSAVMSAGTSAKRGVLR